MNYKFKKPEALMNGVKSYISGHRTQILTGFGVAGMASACVMVGKETPTALMLIEKRKQEINRLMMEEALDRGDPDYGQITDIPMSEKFKTCWKVYTPSVIVATIGASCIFAACAKNCRANAALGAALHISESALKDYKESAKEIVGDEAESRIVDRAAEKKLEAAPINKHEIFSTGKGNTLCFDTVSGRYFVSSPEIIRKAESYVNKCLVEDMICTLNEFYGELNLPEIAIGESLGWEVGKTPLCVSLTSKLTETDEPCLVLQYDLAHEYWAC